MRSSNVTGIAVLVVMMLLIGIFSFKACYDDHRNQLGFSVWTSITSCSG